MRLLVLSADILGFLALSIGAVVGSICSSLLGLTLREVAKIGRFLQSHLQSMTNCLHLSTAEKNGTKWYRLTIGSWSLMFGRKI